MDCFNIERPEQPTKHTVGVRLMQPVPFFWAPTLVASMLRLSGFFLCSQCLPMGLLDFGGVCFYGPCLLYGI